MGNKWDTVCFVWIYILSAFSESNMIINQPLSSWLYIRTCFHVSCCRSCESKTPTAVKRQEWTCSDHFLPIVALIISFTEGNMKGLNKRDRKIPWCISLKSSFVSMWVNLSQESIHLVYLFSWEAGGDTVVTVLKLDQQEIAVHSSRGGRHTLPLSGLIAYVTS